MNGETDVDTGLMTKEEEQMIEKEDNQEKNNPSREQSTVIMTDEEFEDTLSEEDCKNFNLIYESLLLEGKAGNLTDLTLGMVLAEKPLAWLQVMHGRLKHLIISSETFKEKKKAKCNA